MKTSRKIWARALGIPMSPHLRHMLFASALFAMVLVLLGAPVASAETYASSGFSYPSHFSNNLFGTNSNDLQYLDAVYFDGREIVIFSLFSSDDLNYNKSLYFYDPGSGYHKSFDISNSQDLDFRFRTCVRNNVLYLFYTPTTSVSGYSTSTIYYRTFTVDYGATGTSWDLVMSGLKSFPAGYSSVKLRTAVMMNGNMVVVFTSGTNWYYVSTPDGLTFPASKTLLTNSDSVRGAGGAVFQVPDQVEGERLMVAFATTGSKLKYFFFNGSSA